MQLNSAAFPASFIATFHVIIVLPLPTFLYSKYTIHYFGESKRKKPLFFNVFLDFRPHLT